MDRVGDVFIENFDRGVVEHTLECFLFDSQYFLDINDVTPPTFPDEYRTVNLRGERMPGIPVYNVNPDTRLVDYITPCFIIRRDDLQEAPERWFSLYNKYRAPAPGADEVSVDFRGETIDGYDKYEQQLASFPYDITYQISCISSGRKAEVDAHKMIKFIMKKFRPKICRVKVVDSFGNVRYYNAESNGPQSLQESLDIVDRQSGFTYNVKVDGELDLADRVVEKAVTVEPIIGFYEKEE